MLKLFSNIFLGMICLALIPSWELHGSEQEVSAFLKKNCSQCHGVKVQKADRRMDSLSYKLNSEETLGEWQDILDQLNLGEMPPAEAQQPDEKSLKQTIAWITNEIKKGHESLAYTGGETVLRRINRREYLNSIRDLLHLNMTIFDPTMGFPDDASVDGFNNIGEALVTSSYLLNHYLEASDQVINRVVKTGPKPKSKLYKFFPPFDRTTNAHSGWVTAERKNTKEYQSIFQGTKERFGYRPLDDIKEGVPYDGFYRVRIKACGLHRNHKYDQDFIGTDVEEPIRLALVSGSNEMGTLHLRQRNEKTLAVFDLPDDEPKWMECRIWLDRGFQPRLTYQNGPYFFKFLPPTLHARYPELFPVKLVYSNWWDVTQNINTPQIRVFAVELKGPFYDQWPPAGHKSIFGQEPYTQKRANEVLKKFASRAFRRSVKQSELDSLLALVKARQQSGDNELESIKAGLSAILCSPGFLYLNAESESKDSASNNSVKKLDNYALATRLSYFLWSSIPDKTLLEMASKKQLSKPDVLLQQAQRMLSDPKASALRDNFTDRWLGLYKLGEMPPEARKFKDYYVHELELAMKQESHLFFDHLLKNNLSIDHFIDSNFTFVNRPLARHYNIDMQHFDQQFSNKDSFRKVTITNPYRGGLLGQASVLTVTANGIDTSPVLRGVWVLENILGTPPSPPPPDVEPLEPDIRGSKNIRTQLEKHRNVTACKECHRKIDPPGFALEAFDAIGGDRPFYDSKKRKPVDTAGVMSDGQKFSDIKEFKKILLSRKDQFAHCLTEKLLTYATGRQLSIRERPDVDEIVNQLNLKDRGLRDLILLTIQSDAFLNK